MLPFRQVPAADPQQCMFVTHEIVISNFKKLIIGSLSDTHEYAAERLLRTARVRRIPLDKSTNDCVFERAKGVGQVGADNITRRWQDDETDGFAGPLP